MEMLFFVQGAQHKKARGRWAVTAQFILAIESSKISKIAVTGLEPLGI